MTGRGGGYSVDGAHVRSWAVVRHSTVGRKRFQLELEITGDAIQPRRPLWPSQKLSGHPNQSWLVGDFAPKRALVEFAPEDGFTDTLRAEHDAMIRPNSGGSYYRPSWQCMHGCRLPRR